MLSHLKDNDITYWKHFKRSMKFSLKSSSASFCFFIHAVYPDIFKTSGSTIIKEMNFD